MSRRTTALAVLALTVLVVAFSGDLLYARWMRARLLPSALRYLPPETNVLVGVGDLASLWDGVEFHFGRVIRETGRKGALATEFAEIDKTLTEKKLRVREKEDLICSYGFDIDRGALVGLSAQDSAYSVVIPVASDPAVVDRYCHSRVPRGTKPAEAEAKLVGFFCAFFCTGSPPILLRHQGKEANDPCSPAALLTGVRSDRAWTLEDHAYALGDHLLVFPRPDTAVLSSSCSFLRRGLAEQERNLSYARADDSLFEAVRYQLRRPLLSGPGVLAYVRGGVATDFSPVGAVAAAVNLVPDAVLGDLRLRTTGVNARIVDNFLTPPGRERPWRGAFGADGAAALVLRDDALRRYIDLASNDPGFNSFFKQFLGGILESVRRLDHLDQIVLCGTDYQDGLPILVLGIWGSRDELAHLVSETQRRLRRVRDEQLPPGLLTPPSFTSPEYVEPHGNHQIRYLEPAITEADLKSRFITVVDPKERRILLQNRYRLASVMTGNVLWVGTGRGPLLRLLDQSGRARPSKGFTLGAELDRDGGKMRVLANTTALIRMGMLSGESKLQEITEQILLDFRYHREVTISLKPTGNEQEVEIDFVARGVSLPLADASLAGKAIGE